MRVKNVTELNESYSNDDRWTGFPNCLLEMRKRIYIILECELSSNFIDSLRSRYFPWCDDGLRGSEVKMAAVNFVCEIFMKTTNEFN